VGEVRGGREGGREGGVVSHPVGVVPSVEGVGRWRQLLGGEKGERKGSCHVGKGREGGKEGRIEEDAPAFLVAVARKGPTC